MDKLADYRGLGRPRRAAQADPHEPDPGARAADLHARMLVGTAAARLMAAVGTAEDAGKVLAAVIARVEREVQEGMATLLDCPDPASPDGRELHFNARVALQTLRYLNDLVRDGERAAQALYESEQ